MATNPCLPSLSYAHTNTTVSILKTATEQICYIKSLSILNLRGLRVAQKFLQDFLHLCKKKKKKTKYPNGGPLDLSLSAPEPSVLRSYLLPLSPSVSHLLPPGVSCTHTMSLPQTFASSILSSWNCLQDSHVTHIPTSFAFSPKWLLFNEVFYSPPPSNSAPCPLVQSHSRVPRHTRCVLMLRLVMSHIRQEGRMGLLPTK